MNTESKSPSIPATPMGEDTPSSDESTSPPWYTSEPKGSMVNFGSPTELPQIYDEYNNLCYREPGQFVPLESTFLWPHLISTPTTWKTCSYQWELPLFAIDDIRATHTLTLTEFRVEVLTCGQYVYQVYGLFGLNILEKVIIALEHPRVLNDYGIIQMGARPGWIDVLFLQDIPWVHTMLMWFCSAFRAPILGMVSLSYGTPEDTDVFELQPLEPLPVMSSIHHCCSALFGSAAIAARPGTDTTRELLLDIDRSIVGEYVRREYVRVLGTNLAHDGRFLCFLERAPHLKHTFQREVDMPEWVLSTRVLLQFCPLCFIEQSVEGNGDICSHM